MAGAPGRAAATKSDAFIRLVATIASYRPRGRRFSFSVKAKAAPRSRHFQKRAGSVRRSISCRDRERHPRANARCEPVSNGSRKRTRSRRFVDTAFLAVRPRMRFGIRRSYRPPSIVPFDEDDYASAGDRGDHLVGIEIALRHPLDVGRRDGGERGVERDVEIGIAIEVLVEG